MAAEKVKPSELGCSRPYTLSAKGKIFVDAAGATCLRTFIDTYQKSGRALIDLIHRWWGMGGDHQVFSILLVCPMRVAPTIETTALWQKAQASVRSHAGSDWSKFASIRPYHILRALAGIEGRAARGPEIVQRLLAEIPLPDNLITAEVFAEIFEPFPSEGWRGKLTAQVVGMLRAFFSQSENARRENAAKTAELTRLRALHPEFFISLERLLKAQAAWQRACRAVVKVRRQLISEGVPMATVNACQMQAILERADLHALQPVLAEHSPLTLAPLVKLAAVNRQVVERLLTEFPSAGAPDAIESDLVRRLSSGNRIREVANDPFLATRLLELYDAHIDAMQGEHAQLKDKVQRVGAKVIHMGWRAVMNARTGSALGALKSFFAKELVPFAEALRPIRMPVLRAVAAVRSPWLDEADEWRLVEKAPGGIGNAIKVELRLPAVLAQPAQTISAVLRGNIAFASASKLETPLNVLDGILQFRPDQALPVPGDPSRKTYLKAQGLRVWHEGDEFFGGISTRRMTESLLSSPKPLNEDRSFGDGQRLAVLHLCPGGMRLGTLTVFECRAARWRIVPIRDVVARSDADAFEVRDDRRVRVRNNGLKSFGHLDFDLNALGIAIDAQMAKLVARSVEPTSIEANRENIARLMPVKTALGQSALQRIAHRIGSTLARNRVAHLILAGSGVIATRGGATVPVRQFFALQSVGLHKVATGYLTFAAQKAGVGISTISGRFGLIDSKGYLSGSDAPIVVGVPFRRLGPGEDGFVAGAHHRTRRGAPEHLHLPNQPGRVVDFSRNAAESILLAWTDEEFRRRGVAALLKTDLRSIELPAES